MGNIVFLRMKMILITMKVADRMLESENYE
jgi:hypothetical protein